MSHVEPFGSRDERGVVSSRVKTCAYPSKGCDGSSSSLEQCPAVWYPAVKVDASNPIKGPGDPFVGNKASNLAAL